MAGIVSQRCDFKVLFSVSAVRGASTFHDSSTDLPLSLAMPVMVASFLVYAWTTDQKTNVAGPIVALVFGGFSIMYGSKFIAVRRGTAVNGISSSAGSSIRQL